MKTKAQHLTVYNAFNEEVTTRKTGNIKIENITNTNSFQTILSST